MGCPLQRGVLDDMKRDRSIRYRREDRRAAVVRNNAAPDKRRLPADAVERILPLPDPGGSANLGGDRKMHRPVLVGKPEQFLHCAQRTPNGGRRCLVESHARSPLALVGRWPHGPCPDETELHRSTCRDNFRTLLLGYICNVRAGKCDVQRRATDGRSLPISRSLQRYHDHCRSALGKRSQTPPKCTQLDTMETDRPMI